MNAKRAPTNTRKNARKASTSNHQRSNIASLPSLIERGLAGSFCASCDGYEDCTNQPHWIAPDARRGWLCAILASIIINAAFACAFAAKIACAFGALMSR